MHFKNPPHWCHVIKDKEGGVLSSNVSVYYNPQTKLQEGIVFTGLCHSLQGGSKYLMKIIIKKHFRQPREM